MFRNTDEEKKLTSNNDPGKQRSCFGVCLAIKSFSDLMHIECYKNIVNNLDKIAVYLNKESFSYCYRDLLDSYFSYTQAIPELGKASLASLFNHSLLRAYSMQLAVNEYYQQSDNQSDSNQELARYIAFSAGLLMDISQIYTHSKVVVCNESGRAKGIWDPFRGSLQQLASGGFYKVYPSESILLNRSSQLSLLLSRSCMPKVGMDWIAQDEFMLGEWIKLICAEPGVIGPFAYALQHFQRFMLGIEIPADWLGHGLFPEWELGEDFFRWLQSLNDTDVAALGEAVQNTAEGTFLDLDTLSKAFEKTAAGRVLSETHGGTIALHAAIASQFRDIFPFGVDAVIKARGRSSGVGFSGSQGAKRGIIMPKGLVKAQKNISSQLVVEKVTATKESTPVVVADVKQDSSKNNPSKSRGG